MTKATKVGKAHVWENFIIDLAEPDHALCQVKVGARVCGTKVYAKGNTTSTMFRHLKI